MVLLLKMMMKKVHAMTLGSIFMDLLTEKDREWWWQSSEKWVTHCGQQCNQLWWRQKIPPVGRQLNKNWDFLFKQTLTFNIKPHQHWPSCHPWCCWDCNHSPLCKSPDWSGSSHQWCRFWTDYLISRQEKGKLYLFLKWCEWACKIGGFSFLVAIQFLLYFCSGTKFLSDHLHSFCPAISWTNII